ncbi:MAG TPA: FAD/NAD(P)-binding protein, partial [Candidatus Eisenbacteria bacterium]|nr:FAD/NAD(P)-binding protein [Candidatus Eisenbacteria bacterium]
MKTNDASDFRAVVIGAGASGVLAAVHIARAGAHRHVALVEAGTRTARGLAYGTPYGAHLLNVPARRMSAFPDRPDHFAVWLMAHVPGSGPETYAPRPLYGEYLAHVLNEARDSGASVTPVPGTAVDLSRADPGWRVHLDDGRSLGGAAVVLALGNLAPGDPPELAAFRDDRYVRDPWAPGVAAGLDREAPVLTVGTGLTMVDLVLALRAEGHRGPVHALSRHGRLPQEHTAYPVQAIPEPPALSTPAAAARWIRLAIAGRLESDRHRPSGHPDWRAVVDSLRPHTARIWSGWSLRRRASFLRHARSLWDVHRHRIPPEVAARVRALVDAGELTIHAGRITGIEARDEGLRVRWRRRGGAEERSLAVARVINATGPASNYATLDVPLVARMRRAGDLVPDALGLGIETRGDGALLGRHGNPVPGLYPLGPLRRP